MDAVAIAYLKKIGVKIEKSDRDFSVIVDTNNYRFPTVSCKLKDGENGNLIFSLNYFISDDFSKQCLEFTFEDWYNWKRGSNLDLFGIIKKNLGFDFFQYFSITETLLTRVYQSRLNGRKAWKKRNFRLPIKKASVINAFGIEKEKNEKNERISEDQIDFVKAVEQIIELDEIMHKCILRAAYDYSYAPFDVYFDCYKKKMNLERKIGGTETVVSVASRINRDKVFKDFAKQVVELQKLTN